MKLSRRSEKLIPSYGLWPFLFAVGLQFLVYFGTRLVAGDWPHMNMQTALDRAIPFLPWTVVLYVAAFLFWVTNYILAIRQGEEQAWRILAADLLGKLVCLAVFLLLPTTAPRPDIPEAPFAWAMGIIYAADAPDNLFPSIHCFCSWLCWAGIRGRKNIPTGYRAFSLVMALAVGLSTLTTKQHVLADVAAGFALAEVCWQISGRTRLSAWYGAAVKRLSRETVTP